MSRTVQGGAACLRLLILVCFMYCKMFGCSLDWYQFCKSVFLTVSNSKAAGHRKAAVVGFNGETV